MENPHKDSIRSQTFRHTLDEWVLGSRGAEEPEKKAETETAAEPEEEKKAPG